MIITSNTRSRMNDEETINCLQAVLLLTQQMLAASEIPGPTENICLRIHPMLQCMPVSYVRTYKFSARRMSDNCPVRWVRLRAVLRGEEE